MGGFPLSPQKFSFSLKIFICLDTVKNLESGIQIWLSDRLVSVFVKDTLKQYQISTITIRSELYVGRSL